MVRFAASLSAAALIVALPAAAQDAAPAIAPAAPAIAVIDPLPEAPVKVAASFTTPPRNAAGRYATPARDLPVAQAAWYLRVALNVAALGCRDADEPRTVAAYNAFLAAQRDDLAAARAAVLADASAIYGAAAQARDDDAMTRASDFYAQPAAHDGFCTAAKQVLGDLATVSPGALHGVAAAVLERLDAPFVAMFSAHHAWRTQVAAWHARHPASVMPAIATPVALATAEAAPPVVVATAAVVPVALRTTALP